MTTKEKIRELQKYLNSIEQTCNTCGESKRLEFYPKQPRGGHGVGRKCKVCTSQAAKERRLNPPTPYDIEQAKLLKKQEVADRKAMKLREKEERKKQREAHRLSPEYLNKIREREARAKRWQETLAQREKKFNDPVYIKEQKLKEQKSQLWWERKHKRETEGSWEASWLNWRIANNLRSRVSAAVRAYGGGKKNAKTIELLGCSIEHFKQHLQCQFKTGMSFDNYGDWHVDHIVPCASFDLSDPEQQKQCFHYMNLQPLWAKDNMRKSAKILYPIQMHLPLSINP